MIAGGSIRYDLMTQETKNELLRITMYEGIVNGGDDAVLEALERKKQALLAAGAQWEPSPHGDYLPSERVA